MAWFRGEVCAARVADVRASHMRARRQASHTPLQRRQHQYSRTAVARAAKASVAAARERGGKTAAQSVAGWTPPRARCSPLICLRAPSGHCSAPTQHAIFTPSCRTPVQCTSGKVLAPARPSLPPSASSTARAGSTTPDSVLQKRIARTLSRHRYPCQPTTWSLMFADCAVNGAGCALLCQSLLRCSSNRVKLPSI